MSKIIGNLSKLGVKPGVRVSGLFAQTLQSVYQPMFNESEVISSIEQHPEDDEMAIVKTEEMNSRTHIYTSEGEKELPEENRQYVINSINLLKIIDNDLNLDQIKAMDDENKERLDLSKSSVGVDTSFSTLPSELIESLTPFLNYVNANKDALDDTLDVDSLTFSADGVSYNMDTLTALTKVVSE